MPIHEYICDNCGTKFEDVSMRIEDVKEILKCPKCESNVTKSISCGSFIIHGYNESNGYAGHMR